jgi:hypothetical protein
MQEFLQSGLSLMLMAGVMHFSRDPCGTFRRALINNVLVGCASNYEWDPQI